MAGSQGWPPASGRAHEKLVRGLLLAATGLEAPVVSVFGHPKVDRLCGM